MQVHSRRIRILAATGVVAVGVLATGSTASTRTPAQPAAKETTAVLSLLVDRDGEWYVWKVNGAQRGLAFR